MLPHVSASAPLLLLHIDVGSSYRSKSRTLLLIELVTSPHSLAHAEALLHGARVLTCVNQNRVPDDCSLLVSLTATHECPFVRIYKPAVLSRS